jgi:hypothetical protein
VALTLEFGPRKFPLSDKTLEAMWNLVDATEDKEKGFPLCWERDEIVPGRECSGEECAIIIEDCSGRPVAGGFHTHPKGPPEPSTADLVTDLMSLANQKSDGLGCVGGIQERDTIRCDLPRRLPSLDELLMAVNLSEEQPSAPAERFRTITRLFHLPRHISRSPGEEVPEARIREVLSQYSLPELMQKAYSRGISAAGTNEELAWRLIKEGVA